MVLSEQMCFYVHIGGIRIDYVTSAVYEGLRILDWLLGKKKKNNCLADI